MKWNTLRCLRFPDGIRKFSLFSSGYKMSIVYNLLCILVTLFIYLFKKKIQLMIKAGLNLIVITYGFRMNRDQIIVTYLQNKIYIIRSNTIK